MRRTLAAVAAVAATLGSRVVPAHAGTTKTVSVKNNSFSPSAVSVKKGGKVAWKWTQGGVVAQRHARGRRLRLAHDEPEGLHVHQDVLEGRDVPVRVHAALVDEDDRQGELSS